MKRRGFLKAIGAAIGVGAVANAVKAEAPDPERVHPYSAPHDPITYGEIEKRAFAARTRALEADHAEHIRAHLDALPPLDK